MVDIFCGYGCFCNGIKRLMVKLSLRYISTVLALFSITSASQYAVAEIERDAGGFLREQRPIETPKPQPGLPHIEQNKPEPLHAPKERVTNAEDIKVEIKGIRFKGIRTVPESELQAAVSSFIGQKVAMADLETILEAVRRYYRDRAYFVADAYFPEQELTDGILTITVSEGWVDQVNINVPKGFKVRPFLWEAYRDAFIGLPLKQDVIERRLLLLSDISGVAKALGRLSKGQAVGASGIEVDVKSDEPLWSAEAELDNYGGEFTGKNRASLLWRLQNAAEWGGDVMVKGQKADGLSLLYLSLQQPLSASGLKLKASASRVGYQLCCGFSGVSAHGGAIEANIGLSYPILRQQYYNLTFESSMAARKLANYAVSTIQNDKRVKNISAMLSGDYQIPQKQAWVAGWLVGIVGQVDLSRQLVDQSRDAIDAQTQGKFAKLSYSAAVFQRIAPRWSVYAKVSGQMASKNLDSSERISLGGINGVRAYPDGEITGDEGWQSSMEARYNFLATGQLAAFFDYGRIHLHRFPWRGSLNGIQNRYGVAGAGMSVRYQYPITKTDVSLIWARPIGAHPIGMKPDSDRFWLSFRQPLN